MHVELCSLVSESRLEAKAEILNLLFFFKAAFYLNGRIIDYLIRRGQILSCK